MSSVHAPYGFVPLNDKVFLPDWAGITTQDRPFQDGVCGTIEFELHAHTDIFVRGTGGEHDKVQHFFKGPGGFAIPGSSLRGVLRTTMEIASFGWMKQVNDHRYGVRDLQNQNLYVRHMAGILPDPSGKKLPMPKVMAGWLKKSGGGLDRDGSPEDVVATITPCSFAKFEYRDLVRFAASKGVQRFAPGERQRAGDKYASWGVTGATDPKLEITVEVEALRPRDAVPLPVDFGRVVGKGQTKGTVVFTGQPNRWDPNTPPRGAGAGQPKHHDFVFYARLDGRPVPVTREVMSGFEFVHGGGQEKHSFNQRRSRNEEWEFWGREFDEGGEVPVFFLLEEAAESRAKPPPLRAFGLAMMFRLAYKYTTRDAVRHAQRGLDTSPEPDLAELIFGHVPSGAGVARKGRVSIGMAVAQGNPQPRGPVTAVLGAPKASFYPAYVEQDPARPGAPPSGGKDHYKTYMDADVRIRGHKRYRPQPTVVTGPPPPTNAQGQVNDKVGSEFCPLPAGTRFRGTAHVHNLRLVELGALLWALDFGGRADRFHTVGMARNLGYGRATFTVIGTELVRNDGAVAFDLLSEARRDYAEAMEAFAAANNITGGWASSARIAEMLALAEVLQEGSPHRHQMSIARTDPNRAGGKINEFTAAKRNGDVLPNASRPVRAFAGSQGAGGYRPASGPSASAPAPVTPAWVPIRGGTPLEVELVGLNARGRWQVKATVQGFDVTATIGQGTPPAGAAPGEKRTVTVVAGGDRRNLGLKW